MAKNLNVSMTFTADTSQAKKEMKSLQDQLSKLGNATHLEKGFGAEFNKSIADAKHNIAELQVSLKNAFNVDTGKLDFTKFNDSLKKSGKTLEDYGKSLSALGPEGQQAFLELTQAVAKSEIPIIRVNDKLKSLGVTLANTARWQISSSVLHGFMGALQSAYGYAQDLNRSLNDIRIVTGYSADEMAKFAEQANKSAQALSTTTTAYTDAALIFYQQGLNDEEVQKRTDATIKMANVTGENAEHVSSYMTAIWNNFDDGSKSLEYYADVMTQLGAATAASSEEIAEGMEKFAAVGETVGLSYEYAAAAVTTVIDKTRQSADIVGTSFKTIFARLEGLQLGETLEDGTTLNKYSKALATVGINIKDQNGELKDMDQILDEMGAKWETLNKDQQVALAQTVGGVRQYTQLIALMDNFDAFRKNVQLGLDSEGTLQEQQDIYAESWEASAERVRAAWEALYSDIIKDDFFIELNNNLTKFLQGLDKLIDGLGGIKGILSSIAPILMPLLTSKTIGAATSLIQAINLSTVSGQAKVREERREAIENALSGTAKAMGKDSPEYYQLNHQIELNKTLEKYRGKLSESDQEILRLSLAQAEAEAQQLKTLQDTVKAQEKLNEESKKQFQREDIVEGVGKTNALTLTDIFSNRQKALGLGSIVIGQDVSKEVIGGDLQSYLEANKESLSASREMGGIGQQTFNRLIKLLNEGIENNFEEIVKIINRIEEPGGELEKEIEKNVKEIVKQSYQSGGTDYNAARGAVTRSREKLDKMLGLDPTKLRKIDDQEIKVEERNKEIDIEIANLKSQNALSTTTKEQIENNNKQIVELEHEGKNLTEQFKLYKGSLADSSKVQKDLTKAQETQVENILSGARNSKGLAVEGVVAQSRVNRIKNDLKNPRYENQAADLAERTAKVQALTQNMQGLATAVTSAYMSYQHLSNIMTVWGQVGEGDISVGQGIINTLTTTATIIPGLIMTIKALQGTQIAATITATAFWQALMGPVGIVAAAVAGLTALGLAIYNFADGAANKLYEAEKAANLERLKTIKTTNEENQKISESIKLWDELTNKYKEGLTTREEYEDSLVEIAEKLEIENTKLYDQIGAYDTLNALIAEKKDLERDSARESAKQSTSIVKDQILSAAMRNHDWLDHVTSEENSGKIVFDAGMGELEDRELELYKAMLVNPEIAQFISRDKDKITVDIDSMNDKQLLSFLENLNTLAEQENKFGTRSDNELMDGIHEFIRDQITKEELAEILETLGGSIALEQEADLQDIVNSAIESQRGASKSSYKELDEAYRAGLSQALASENPSGLTEEQIITGYKEEFSLLDPERFAKLELVKETFDRLNISMDSFYSLNEKEQDILIDGLIASSDGFGLLKLGIEDLSEIIPEMQESLDTLEASNFIEQVNNVVDALDGISSGDIKTPEEWIKLLGGEDIYNKLLTSGDIVLNGAGTKGMYVGDPSQQQQILQDQHWNEIENLKKRNENLNARLTSSDREAINSGEFFAREKEYDYGKYIEGGASKYRSDEEYKAQLVEWANKSNSIDEFLKYLTNQENFKSNGTLGVYNLDEERANQFADFVKSTGITNVKDLSTILSGSWEESSVAGLAEINEQIKNNEEEIKKLTEESYDFTQSYSDLKKQYTEFGVSINRTNKDYVQASVRRSAQEFGLVADEVVEYGKYLDENNEKLKDNAIMADAVALAYSRADKGLQDLNSNFETWNKTLTDNTEDSKEYAEAMDGFETALQNIFNTEEDISNDFILEHMGDIQKAAEGDLEAITDLQIAFASINAENAFAEAGKDLEQFKNELDTVEWSKIKIGDDIIDSDPILQKWFNTMNQMVAAGDMAASDMEAIWNSLGYELEPQTEYVDIDEATGISYMGMPAGIKNLKTIKVKVVKGFKAKGSSYTGTNAAASKITNDNGGGKGGSSKGSKEKDYEKERYYTITRQIQDATDAFNEYEKAKDRAAGKAKVGYIDFEIENLKERQRLQKEYLKEIEDYYKQDQAKLNFFGAAYDENGVLTNYDEIFNRLQQKYKDAVASGSEEAINAAQQDMDAFIAAANQYDKTNQLYQSELIKDAELAREEIDKTIEKIDTTLTLKVEIDDRSLKLLEYQLGRIEGGAFTQGTQMANRQAQLNLQLDEQAATRQALDDLLKENKLTENDLATKTPEELVALGIDDKVLDKMKEYADKLLEIQGNIDALEEAILGGALEAFEEFNAEFDYQSKIIEHQTKLLKSYKDIAELVYGNAGLDEGFMIDLMGTSQETMLARTAATRTKLEADRQALAKAREAFANYSGGDEKVQKQLEEDVRSMEETVIQGEEDLLSQTQENLQQAKEIFDRTLEAAKQDYLKAVGADDWSVTLFDRATKIDDQYLDDYEKIYHLAKLTRDVNNSIDDTPAFRGKQRLREVTEEILELEKEGVKVSQYQVDALRAKYELRLAEIALEDAQNAKSTVRMARDNEGNWSYVYTSDADATDKAKQNYEDKLYEYQKLNTDYIKKQQKTYQDLAREFGEEYTKIANDSVLTPEEKEYRLQETKDYYAELMDITTSELDLALGYNKSLYEDDWTSYNKYTGYKISAQKDYVDQFNETILGEITGLESGQEAYENWANVLTGEDGYITKVDIALSDFTEAQERALEILGTDLDDFASHVGTAMTNAANETENAKNAIEDNAKRMEDFFNSLADAIKKLNDLRINDMRDDTTNVINNINSMIKAYNDLAEAKKKASDVPSTGDKSGYDQSSLDNSGGNRNNGVKTGDEPYLKNNTITALNGYGGVDPVQNMLWKENNPTTFIQLKNYLTSSAARVLNVDPVFVNGIRNAKNLKEFGDFLLKHGKQEDFKKFLRGNSGAGEYGLPTIGFDTGGYTGSWGDSGRLAFLHQKELVLNAQDTANMLQMTNMVRELSEYIDFQAAATNLGRVSTTIGSVSALAGGELNQNVHIEATFPNVSEAYEIEEALTNLVNRAAQYANRK